MPATKTKTRSGPARGTTKWRTRGSNRVGKYAGGSTAKGDGVSKRGKLTRRGMEVFLCKKLSVDDHAAHMLWSLIVDKMRSTLLKGKPVALPNIGTLEPFVKQPTRYRHPETGEMENTPRRRHVRFVLSPNLKAALRRSRK